MSVRSPERMTQSFVGTMSACWRRPVLTVIEIAWRWAFGIPALFMLWREGERILADVPLDGPALREMTLLDPLRSSQVLAAAVDVLWPPVARVAVWLVPLLLVGWVAVSALGRTAVLRRVDRRLHARTGTLMALQAVRMAALAASFGVWFACLQGAAHIAVTAPLAAGEEPSLVLYFALAIVATLGLFTLWAVVSWGFAVAPLLAMLHDWGAGRSLAAAFRVGPLRIKLVEINLVMGIVKIALIVLALVFSASPLPFEGVASTAFLRWWWAGVAVLYLVASDFFHVARVVAYLDLWRDAAEPYAVIQ